MGKLKFVLLLFLLLPASVIFGQADNFPKGYFRNPLDIPIYMAGGFGEVRPNHFHTGMDIKTNSVENLPVHATADGYVSHISISARGYGNALHITHPNGYTTVYAHLNDFYPELQKWVIEQQYAQKTWEVELYPDSGLFRVKKGQIIAQSGNTGGSTGPHLHFEIRDSKSEHVLNSMRFGLPYEDNLAPQVEGLALYNADKSIYNQDPEMLPLRKVGTNKYMAKDTLKIISFSNFFLGVEAKDFMNGSTNWMGIYNMKLFLDNRLEFEVKIDEIDFDFNRYVNAYMDYKTQKATGRYFQLLYRLPNNQLQIYPFMNKNNGALTLLPGAYHKIRLELYDPLENKSVVEFYVQYKGKTKIFKSYSGCENGSLWNCRKDNAYQDFSFKFTAPGGAFYDDLCFVFSVEKNEGAALSDKIQIMNNYFPIQKACTVSLKLNREVPIGLRSKLAFVHHVKASGLPGNNPQSGMAVVYNNGFAEATVRTFGNFYCVIDTIPPKISAAQQLSSQKSFSQGQPIRFNVTDELTSVNSFKASINGQWLRFVQRGNTYTYFVDEHCPLGQNTMEVVATDENGNVRRINYNFTRQK